MSLTLLETGLPVPSRPQLRRVGVPLTEPPYDDELDANRGQLSLGWHRPFSDGSLALTLPLPLPIADRPVLRLVPDLPRTDARTGRDITPDFLPDPRPRATQLVRAVLEVLAGDRPAHHLNRVTAEEVQTQIEESMRPCSVRPWAKSLHSLRLSLPSPGVAEVTAVVNRGVRCAALALRMEGLDGRWIITELALP